MAKKDNKKAEKIVKDEIKNEENLKDKDFRIKNFKEEIDKYIKERVNEETKKGINIKDYKEQIDKYAKERVEIESSSQTVKSLKKELHSKKISSGIKTFIIFCLLVCIGYGVYYLYDDGYFDEKKNETSSKINNDSDSKQDENNTSKTDKKEEKPVEKTEEEKLQDLINEYSYLLENIKFDANSNYTRDYYNGNLTSQLKEYLAFKLIDSQNIISDDDSSYFESSDLEEAYSIIFNEKLAPSSFKYNNQTFLYLESKDMFISNNKANEEKNISREIINVELSDGNITLTTVEGYISENGKLYNILTNKQISSYKVTDSLVKHKNKLNIVKYTFKEGKLINISK